MISCTGASWNQHSSPTAAMVFATSCRIDARSLVSARARSTPASHDARSLARLSKRASRRFCASVNPLLRTAITVAAAADLAVVTIPLRAVGTVPVEPLAGKVVIDTNNYYPARDGQVAELDDHTATSSGLLQRHLPASRVVKAFNHIQAAQLAADGLPAGTADRRALAAFGDDEQAVALVQRWLDELGYDSVHGGPLAESWRIEPGTPGYGPRLDVTGLRTALSDATR